MAEIQLNKPLYNPASKGPKTEEDERDPMPRVPKVGLGGRLFGVIVDIILLHFVALGIIRFFPDAVLSLGETAPFIGLGAGIIYFTICSTGLTRGQTFGKLMTRVRVTGVNGVDLSLGRGIVRGLLLTWPLIVIVVFRILSEHADKTSKGIPTLPAFELLGPALAGGWYLGNFVFLIFDPFRRTIYDRLCGSFEVTTDAPPDETSQYMLAVREYASLPPVKSSVSGFIVCMLFFLIIFLGKIFSYLSNVEKLPADKKAESLVQRAKMHMDGFGQPVPTSPVNPDIETSATEQGNALATFQYRRRGSIDVDKLKQNPRVESSIERISTVIFTPYGFEGFKSYLNSMNEDRVKHGQATVSAIPKFIRLEVSFAEKPDLFFAWKNLPVYSMAKRIPFPDKWMKEIENEFKKIAEKERRETGTKETTSTQDNATTSSARTTTTPAP